MFKGCWFLPNTVVLVVVGSFGYAMVVETWLGGQGV